MTRYGLLLIVLLSDCQSKDRLNATQETVQIRSEETTNKAGDVWSTFEVNSEKSELPISEDNLFGKFYEDRIEFHIIDNPDLQVYNAEVNRITLYYIDGILCRKKYDLKRNVANELVRQYGATMYKSLNHETDSLARQMGIILFTPTGRYFNPYLKRYQLKWTLPDKSIYFHHQQDSVAPGNFYIEELAEYKQRYKSVQKELI